MNKSLVLSLEDDEQDLIIFRCEHDVAVREAGGQLSLSPAQAYWLHERVLAHLAGPMPPPATRKREGKPTS